MGLLTHIWQGFAGGPDLNRQQQLRFVLEDTQLRLRLPYSNIATVEQPRVINFPYLSPGWFESHMKQQKQHCFVHLQTKCWYYLAPVLRIAHGEFGNLFCRIWLKRVPEGVDALDRQQLAEYVIKEHDEHFNAAIDPNPVADLDAPYDHGRGVNTEIRQQALAEAKLAASRGSTYRLDNLDERVAISINSRGYPPLAPANTLWLDGKEWVFYQDKQRQDSPDAADFYCLPLDNRYYLAISFRLTVTQSGKKRWRQHAQATQQIILDSLVVGSVENRADNLLVDAK